MVSLLVCLHAHEDPSIETPNWSSSDARSPLSRHHELEAWCNSVAGVLPVARQSRSSSPQANNFSLQCCFPVSAVLVSLRF